MFTTIVSGGQSGADHAGLVSGNHLKIPTGGQMPNGFLTHDGPKPSYAKLFGMTESSSASYRPRTEHNVKFSDGTLIVGNIHSPGSLTTRNCCGRMDRPMFHVNYPHIPLDFAVIQLVNWLEDNHIRILNVAGNREHIRPGIYTFTFNLLTRAYRGQYE